MGATQLKVTLPDDMAERIRARVASGEFASESDVIIEAFEELEDRDRSVEERFERWLRTEVVEACVVFSDRIRYLSVK